MPLRERYAMSGTGIAYVCHGTQPLLWARYAMSGTDIAYHGGASRQYTTATKRAGRLLRCEIKCK
eukprot:2391404-Rhodomonas_salina.3